ncbi:hypothetical protein ACFU99_38510 [Streptomyces sp. NPDC057654]|uniref:hypothetical protein n=1 Tax=Streptomyces sp. NPDC057654 TaxID=3346196 RepID=UPI0036B1ED55
MGLATDRILQFDEMRAIRAIRGFGQFQIMAAGNGEYGERDAYGERREHGEHGGGDRRKPVPARRVPSGPVRQQGRADV